MKPKYKIKYKRPFVSTRLKKIIHNPHNVIVKVQNSEEVLFLCDNTGDEDSAVFVINHGNDINFE